MSYRVQGSGSLKAVDYEDQLGLEGKGGGGEDINGARAISGASVKWNPVWSLRSLRFEARGTWDSPKHSNHWRVQHLFLLNLSNW